MYLYHPRDRSKLTFLIHCIVHSLYHCKILNNFSTRFDAGNNYKDSRNEPTIYFFINQEVDATVQHAVDEILYNGKYIKLSENIDKVIINFMRRLNMRLVKIRCIS